MAYPIMSVGVVNAHLLGEVHQNRLHPCVEVRRYKEPWESGVESLDAMFIAHTLRTVIRVFTRVRNSLL
jgi:hypothetical protein